MAEALAEHQITWKRKDDPENDRAYFIPTCSKCGQLAAESPDEHRASVLAANGYGKLEDAKSAALREAALDLMNVSEHDSRMPGIRFAVGFLAGQRRPE